MSCPVCKSQGLQFEHINVLGASRHKIRDIEFIDNKRKVHTHTVEAKTTDYKCSLGHNWSDVKYENSCSIPRCKLLMRKGSAQ